MPTPWPQPRPVNANVGVAEAVAGGATCEGAALEATSTPQTVRRAGSERTMS
jgi:hypothetical protein